MNTTGSEKSNKKSSLDSTYFDLLSSEALLLIRKRKHCTRKERAQIKSKVAELKETTTKAALNRRSSTSQQ